MYVFIAVKVLHVVLTYSFKKKPCVKKSKQMQFNYLMISSGFLLELMPFSIVFYVFVLPYWPLCGVGGVIMVSVFCCYKLFLCLVFAFAAFNVSRKRDILDLDLVASNKLLPFSDMLLCLSLCIHLYTIVCVLLTGPILWHS